MNRVLTGLAMLLPVLAFLAFYFYWPLLTVLTAAISVPFADWVTLLLDPVIWRIMEFTLSQAILTVIISMLIGVPAAVLLAQGQHRYKAFYRVMLTIPFIFPPLVLILGFIVLLGKSGLLAQLLTLNFDPYTFAGIVILHCIYNIPIFARVVETAVASEPKDLHELSDTLNVSKRTQFRTITLPHLLPSIKAAALLVFLYAFNSFAIILILGQVKLQSIEVYIYSQSALRNNLQRASMLVLLQFIINVIVVFYYSRMSTYHDTQTYTTMEPSIASKVSVPILWLIMLLVWSPIIAIVTKLPTLGLPDPSALFSTQFNRFLGTSPFRVILNTIYFGIIVGIVAVTIALLILASVYHLQWHEKAVQVVMMLFIIPMATSAISISYAILMTHGKSASFNDLVWMYIIIAQLFAALPFVLRVLMASWYHIPVELYEVAETLNASFKSIFVKIIYPTVRVAIWSSFTFAFAISIGEFGSTYYLARGDWITLSLAVQRLLNSRNIILPLYYAVILLLFAGGAFLSIEKAGGVEMRI